jgi:cyclic beta-1,2-glucan synthetase
MYRAGIEGILGIRQEGEFLIIDPCIPAAWPGFEATVRRGLTSYEIRVENPKSACRGLDHAELDGTPIAVDEGQVRVALDERSHLVLLRLGAQVQRSGEGRMGALSAQAGPD